MKYFKIVIILNKRTNLSKVGLIEYFELHKVDQ